MAHYVENSAKDFADLREKWISIHCRISQYLLQIVQCNYSKCYGTFRTTWKSVFSSCLLPAPVPVRQISEGTAAPSVSDVNINYRLVDLWKHMSCTVQVLKQNEEQGTQKEWYLFSEYCGSLASQTRWLCPRSIG